MTSQTVLQSSIVFKAHEDFQSNYFRIPFLTVTPKGTLIAGGDIRYTDGSDYNQIDMGIARSEDSGQTWTHKQIVHKNNNIHDHSRKMDGAILVDHITGRIFLFALVIDMHRHLDVEDHDMKSFVYKYSDDDGKTWSDEMSLGHFLDDDCILYFQGPGNGIQLEDGTLVLPIQRWVPVPHLIRCQAGIIYSKDHGQTWEKGEALIDTYTSESAIIEYRPNEILMTSRSPLTSARGFYVTSDLGTTWEEHVSHNTLFEFGGCQSSFFKFTAPNQKTYAVYAAPQQDHSLWDRNKLTLMATDDYVNWNYISEIMHLKNDGYSCFAYDQSKHELYILGEQDGSLIFYNLTCYLPLIMQNTRSSSHQALSTLHKHPVYSQGHHTLMNHPEHWYKLLEVNLKKDGFLLLNMNLLSFHSNELITLKMKQTQNEHHDLSNCSLTYSNLESMPNDVEVTLVPTEQTEDTFTYALYYKARKQDTVSVSIQNCLTADFGKTQLNIYTTFQDPSLEKCYPTLPHSYLDLVPIKGESL